LEGGFVYVCIHVGPRKKESNSNKESINFSVL